MFARLRSWIGGLLGRRKLESEMDAELRLHMASYTEDLVRSGVSRTEAERRARIEFGSVAAVKEECRQARGLRLLDELRQDLRYATRTLAASPGLTGVAILSLALGIGANTAIFSLMDAVLLRFLPVREPQQLYFLAHGTGENPSTGSNYRLLEHYRNSTDVFSGIAAFATAEFKVRNGDAIELVMGQFASGNYYELLGVPMSLGRGFRYESEIAPDENYTAVISDAYWSRRFGRDPGVIGKTLTIEDHSVEIIGVAHPEFFGLYPGFSLDIAIPLSMKTALRDSAFFTRFDNWTSMPLVGRLRPGVSEAEAQASIDLLLQQFLDTPESKWAKENSPEQFSAARLLPASRGLAELRQRFSKPLLVLMGMVGIVLLIACANIANLLLARAAARSKEIAVRLAMGAGRLRIMRQLFTESLVLALLGGGAGILVAIWTTNSLVAMMAVGRYPPQLNVAWDWQILLFTLAVCLLTAILFGLAPAVRATRVDLTPALKEHTLLGPQRQRRKRGGFLVVSQIALCVLLLAAAGLLVRTLHNLRAQNTGFDRENLLLVSLDTTEARLPSGQPGIFCDDLLAKVDRLPGVLSSACSTLSPADTNMNFRRIEVPGLPQQTNQALEAAGPSAWGVWANIVSPGYFKTLGIRLFRGRNFSELDRAGPAKVAIVSQEMARFYFGDADAVGRTFAFPGGSGEPIEIVGIAQNVHQRLRETPSRMVYTPHWLQEDDPPTSFIVALRTAADPWALVGAVKAEVGDLNRDVIVPYVRTMSEQVDAALVQERLLATLSTAFGGLALVLACIGLYGVMAYSVVRRTREMGIRMALGAARRLVLWQVLRESLWLVVLGIVIGLPLAVWAAPALGDLLYELSPTDPVIFLASAALLLVVAAVASYIPARRASRIEPAAALRHE